MPLTASAAVAAVGGLYKLGSGILGNISNNRRAKNLKRPKFNIQQEYYDNVSQADNMAQQGMSDAAKEFYLTNTERGLGAGISGALTTGAGKNSINQMYDTYNRGLLQQAATDAQMHNDNIRYAIDQKTNLAGQKTQQWVLNEYEPYKDEAKAIGQNRAANRINIATGISDITGAVASYAAGQNNDELNMPGQKDQTIAIPDAPQRDKSLDAQATVVPYERRTLGYPTAPTSIPEDRAALLGTPNVNPAEVVGSMSDEDLNILMNALLFKKK